MIGIDVSSHDGYNGSVFSRSNTESCYHDSDFVIAKATQGTTYKYNGFKSVIERCKKDGKLFGFYHYAGGNTPENEAEFFFNSVKPYIKQGVPCLDWESGQNKSWGSTDWCKRFVQRFHELSGVWCLIYIQASALKQAANCASDCGLWVAGYPDYRNNWNIPNFRYSISPWNAYSIWQYSSSNELTDRNTSPLTREQWLKIAAGEGEIDMTNEDVNDIWAFNNFGEGGHSSAWTNLIDTNIRIQAVQAECAALTEAVKTLAESKGADPDEIAKAVSDAVTAKLEKIQLDVKVGE